MDMDIDRRYYRIAAVLREASQWIFSGVSGAFRRPSREAFDVGAQDTAVPRAPADDGGCRSVRARVCVDGLRP